MDVYLSANSMIMLFIFLVLRGLQAAIFSGRTTIYEWITEGLLKPKKMKGKVYILWEDIRKRL